MTLLFFSIITCQQRYYDNWSYGDRVNVRRQKVTFTQAFIDIGMT